MRQEIQFAPDEGQIVVVDRVNRDAELEAGCSHDPLHCREIRAGSSGFPTGKDRLMAAQTVGQLGLGESSPFSCLCY